MLFPRANRGKPRQHPVPSETAQDAADMLAECLWRRVVWRQGTKGALAARFAVRRVRVNADDTPAGLKGLAPSGRLEDVFRTVAA